VVILSLKEGFSVKLNRKGAVSLAAAVAVAAGAGAAFAATSQAGAAGYTDTSLQVSNFVWQHEITGTASANEVLPTTVDVSGLKGAFAPGSSSDRSVVYAIKAGADVDGVTLSVTDNEILAATTTGVISANGTLNNGAVAPVAATVTLTATDTYGDVAVVTVPVEVSNNSVVLGTGSVLTDEVYSITASNDNTNGSVVFAAKDTGDTAIAATSESNLPSGLVSGNPLLPGTAIPGKYNDLEVTAADAAGAQATGSFLLKVNGGPAAVPVLSHGQAYYVSPVRENVAFESSLPTWVKFTITGPGPINGHVGWVYAQGDGVLNTAVYGGLEAKEGYKIIFQPYTGKNGSPVGHYGYVWFVTDKK
jgi:hypothetical protein